MPEQDIETPAIDPAITPAGPIDSAEVEYEDDAAGEQEFDEQGQFPDEGQEFDDADGDADADDDPDALTQREQQMQAQLQQAMSQMQQMQAMMQQASRPPAQGQMPIAVPSQIDDATPQQAAQWTLGQARQMFQREVGGQVRGMTGRMGMMEEILGHLVQTHPDGPAITKALQLMQQPKNFNAALEASKGLTGAQRTRKLETEQRRTAMASHKRRNRARRGKKPTAAKTSIKHLPGDTFEQTLQKTAIQLGIDPNKIDDLA